MFKYIFLIIGLTLIPLSVQAELYKVVNEYGEIIYTDIAPSMDAKEYKLNPIKAIRNPAFNLDKIESMIPYQDESGSMIVQGSVHGVAMRFIVDTGATYVAIPPAIAKQAGLYDLKSKTIKVQTSNGEIEVPRVRLTDMNIGKMSQSRVRATIQTIAADKPNLGLLGMSFLKNYKVTVHQDKKTIELAPK
ncbi:retroviral-like aspartic protease family protein [Mariprofundus ferrooxydans]|nr:retroviral-like aspartic protease family protein [Mariprofundus ferrooxydans]